MCIVLVTRTKRYTIILSNRDEFLARPTLRAKWWPPPNTHVLGGQDLGRPTHGTWLGITGQGRVAVLTNYREETEREASAAALSRGEITNKFLLSKSGVDEWIQEVLESGIHMNVGGFSLMCGVMRKNDGRLAVISNRSSLDTGVDYVLTSEGKDDTVVEYECRGLSNSLLHDEWPKVKLGKALLKKLTANDIQDEQKFIDQAFQLLSYLTLFFRETDPVQIHLPSRQQSKLCDYPFSFPYFQHLHYRQYR